MLTQEEKDIVMGIEMYVFDQTGCRMLQRRIEEAQAPKSQTSFIQALILKITVSKQLFATMMSDQFGNYLC